MTAIRPAAYQFGPFRLEVRDQRLLRDGQVIPLTPKVFSLLRVLVENSGHLVVKDDLLKQVWPDSFVEEGALNRAVSVLRKALDDDPSGQKYIETVPKRGYRFVSPVAVCNDDDVMPPGNGSPAANGRRIGRPLAVAAAIAAIVLVGALWIGSSRQAEGESGRAPLPAPVHRQVTFTGHEGAPAISPDGKRLAYVSDQKPEKKLVVQELAGGQPIEIFGAPEINYLRWSPDGNELLFWARGAGWNGIHVVPQLGGRPRRIAGVMSFLSCWSPDGSRIAVAGALDNKIRLFDARGGNERALTLRGDHWSIWDIDWSANDRLLFASSDKEGRYTVGTIWTDGTGQQTVISSATEIPSARWAPDGDGVYYLRRINQTMSLFRIASRPSTDASAAAGTAVLTGLETDRFFSLSADARRLVYSRAPYHSNLWALDVATGRTTALTQGTSLIERPRVSPDGTSVVFNVGHDPQTNLYTMPLVGGTPKQLTHFRALTIGGAWSPDGSQIAFASTQGGRARIWTIGATGTPLGPVSSGDPSDNFDIAWGPGRRILYQRAGNQNYYEFDPDTRSERLLVPDGSPGWIFAPVYSPDATKLAVAWNRPPNGGVWIIDAADRGETPLYSSAASTMMMRPLTWSSDGAFIYVVEAKNGPFRGATSYVGETMTDARIVRIAVNGGVATTVATIPADEIGSVSLTPDGRLAVYPVFSSRSDVWVADDFVVPLAARR